MLEYCAIDENLEDRLRAQQAELSILRESESRARTVSSISPVGMFRTDPHGDMIYCNRKTEILSGLNISLFLQEGWLRHVHIEDRDRVYTHWREAIAHKKTFREEFRFVKYEGQISWVIGEAIPQFNEDIRMIGFVGTFSDITELKSVQRELKISESRLFEAQRLAGIGYWEWNLSNNEVWWSDEMYVLHGLDSQKDTASYDHMLESVLGTEREALQHKINECFTLGVPYQLHYSVINPETSNTRFLYAEGKQEKRADGTPSRIVGIIQDVTNIKKAEIALEKKEKALSHAQKIAHFGSWVWDAQEDSITWSSEMFYIYGKESSYKPHLYSILENSSPDQKRNLTRLMERQIRQGKKGLFYQKTRVELDIERFLEVQFEPVTNESGVLEEVIGVVRDITIQKKAEASLHREKEKAVITLGSISDAVFSTDVAGFIDFVNPKAELLLGDFLLGQKASEVFSLWKSGQLEKSPILNCLQDGALIELDSGLYTLKNRLDQEYAIELSTSPVFNEAEEFIGSVTVFRDVSEARNLAEQIGFQAKHDSLTGLINRSEFEKKLNELLANAKAARVTHSLLYLDLDQFKIVNDTCGHVAGDELLRQVTSLFSEKVRNSDILARLGGDEFGLLLEKCPVKQASKVAEAFIESLKDFRFGWDGKNFSIGVSIGVVAIAPESESPTAIMSAADTACYAAKDKGRNRVHLFEEADTELEERKGEMQWVSRIEAALNEDRFRLYFQKIKSIANQKEVSHAEILLRMVDEVGDLIPPGAFIASAERYGKMTAIDLWVVESLCKQKAVAMQQDGALHFSVNLSGQSLGDERFLSTIENLLDQYQMPCHQLTFEITETAAIANLKTAIVFINQLKSKGCRFSLDDFGSGLSSFAYLKKLPVDYLKIDGMFVKDIAEDPIDYEMVAAINKIGHVMGMHTIAEFVEDDIILAKLIELGVDYAQGYGIHKPEPF